MSTPELKPCPFCGGESDIEHDHTAEENHAYGCRDCGLWFDTFNADDAITAWNTRATDTRLSDAEAMAEALERAEVTIQNLINVMGTPDQRQCCDGRECGCMGATVYQEAEYYASKDLKAVVAALEKWRAVK